MKDRTKWRSTAETKQEPKLLYLVMKLNTKVETTDLVTGHPVEIVLTGCAGYIPVFETLEEAEESACNGKYQILCIKPNFKE